GRGAGRPRPEAGADGRGRMASEIKLKALKENVESVEVNAIKVAPGETVSKGQTLLEVQADKAALDVPSPMDGKVTEVLVQVGQQITIGQTYCLIEGTNGEAGDGAATHTEGAVKSPEKPLERAEGNRKEPTAADGKQPDRAVARAEAPQP